MAFRIAVPAAVSASAAPVVILVIVARRPRAGEPALVVPCGHITAAIIIIVAIPLLVGALTLSLMLI
jgi:hypothetical protein